MGHQPITRRLAACLLGSAAFPNLARAANASTLRLGVVAPLTGPGAAWGLAAAEAPRIAAAETNANGGLEVGGKRYKVEVIAYDDRYQTADSVAAFNRLVTEDNVRFLSIFSGLSTMALWGNVEENKVVTFTAAFLKDCFNANTKYLFRYYSTPTEYMPAFVSWLKGNAATGLRRVAILVQNDDTGRFHANLCQRSYKEQGFDIVGADFYQTSQNDFQPVLTRIIGLKPEILDVGTSPPATAGLIVRQARELGYGGLIVKSGGPGPRDIVNVAGPKATEGMVNMLYADPKSAGYQRIAAAYRAAQGHEPNEALAPFYDAWRVLLRAVQVAGTVENTAKVAGAFPNALPMTSAQGAQLQLGGKATYGADVQIEGVYYIGVIRGGEPVVVGQIR